MKTPCQKTVQQSKPWYAQAAEDIDEILCQPPYNNALATVMHILTRDYV